MEIITHPQNNTTDLTPFDGTTWLAKNHTVSAVSPEIAINRPLVDLVRVALDASASDSANSARAYQTSIGYFLQFLTDELGEQLPEDWRPLAAPTKQGRQTVWEFRGIAAVLRKVYAGTLDSFGLWLDAKGNNKTTKALRRGAVATFLRVAYRDGVLTQEQALNLGFKGGYKKRERRNEQPVGRRLRPEEVRLLRETVILRARKDRKAARDRALLDCMLYAGLRREETANLRTGNFRQDGGRWWVILTGKGGKTRRVKVHDMLYKSLAEWSTMSGLTLGAGDDPIFCNLTKAGNPTGNALNGSVIGRLVSEYGAAAGLAPLTGENVLAPHDLRRTAARNAYDKGATLPQVQAMLGHSDPQTTMRYIGALTDDTNTAVDRISY
jgi:integrase